MGTPFGMNRIREERVSGSFRWLGLSSGTDSMTPPPPLILRGGFRSPFRGRGRGIVQLGYFFVGFSIFTYFFVSSFLVVGVQGVRCLW